MTRRPLLLLLLALPAAALPACGGDAPAGRVRKGDYRFFCALSNHEELGMYGTLVVR
jgi:hypothetical protein